MRVTQVHKLPVRETRSGDGMPSMVTAVNTALSMRKLLREQVPKVLHTHIRQNCNYMKDALTNFTMVIILQYIYMYTHTVSHHMVHFKLMYRYIINYISIKMGKNSNVFMNSNKSLYNDRLDTNETWLYQFYVHQ